MKVTILLAILFLILTYQCVIPGSASEPAAVVSAVAPVYPPIAQAAHAHGDVVVAADIKSSGDVASTRALSGYPLLQKASVEAARRWKFSTSSEEHRRVELTFSFRIVPEKTAGIDRTPAFFPPYRVEVRSEHLVTTMNY